MVVVMSLLVRRRSWRSGRAGAIVLVVAPGRGGAAVDVAVLLERLVAGCRSRAAVVVAAAVAASRPS